MMNKMTMIAGAMSLALIGSPVQAHSSEMCNYDLDYDLSINNSEITFNKASGEEISINQDNQLFINGTEKDLNSQQQALLDDYADGVRLLIPEVVAIAIEGVNLGVTAAGMALGTLFGEDDPDFSRFTQKVNDLAYSITTRLESDNFSSKAIEEAFDEDFEQEIEAVVEAAVSELAPKLMAKIVAAAMSGDDSSISDLEFRAEMLETDMKELIEPQAEALEARADELCDSIAVLDDLENKMVASGLEMMDLIDKNSNSHRSNKRGKFNFNFGD